MRPGDRVVANGREGVVMTIVPGNGTFRWVYVQMDDGVEDRYPEWEVKPYGVE